MESGQVHPTRGSELALARSEGISDADARWCATRGGMCCFYLATNPDCPVDVLQDLFLNHSAGEVREQAIRNLLRKASQEEAVRLLERASRDSKPGGHAVRVVAAKDPRTPALVKELLKYDGHPDVRNALNSLGTTPAPPRKPNLRTGWPR